MTTQSVSYEVFFSPEFSADPYQVYAGLREKGPVHQVESPTAFTSFVIVDYEHGRAALSDPRFSKSVHNAPEQVRQMMLRDDPVLGDNMLMSDPPDHTRLRRVIAKAFTPRRVEELRPRVQQITTELVDAMAAKHEADLIAELAFPLPIRVICELLGVPSSDRDDFREWSAALLAAVTDEEGIAWRERATADVRAYFGDLIARRRAEPAGDLVSALVDTPELSDRELLSTLVLLMIAGHETTVNLIANGTLALLRNPGQLERLRGRPDLVPAAVEEFLRYDAPVERATFRVAVEDVDVAGTLIPAGSFVTISIGAAGRDPAAFEDADRLDVTRAENRHVAFGHGIHFCLGAPLARMEGQIAFTTLLERLPDLRLGCEVSELGWRFSGSIIRSLSALPVRY
ncbi:MAG: cytochrome P450 [Nonomuraea sp.]|nr:cytochrome P450 [Nonomuraea sp.]